MTSTVRPGLQYIADRTVPNGDAGGVRVNYISRLFDNIGFKVSVISFFEDKKFDGHKNIQYHKIVQFKGLIGSLYRYFGAGFSAICILQKILKTDIKVSSRVVIYSTNLFFILPILFYLKVKKVTVFFDVVENFHCGHYAFGRFGKLSPRYILIKSLYRFIYTLGDGILGISDAIQSHFDNLGVKSICLPPVYQQVPKNVKLKKLKNQINLIYSGVPYGKEDLRLMLKAMELISTDAKNKITLHFTGVDKEKFENFCDAHLIDVQKVMSLIRFHGWVSSDQLHTMYTESHFLFFLRESNQANISNFPMKLIELLSFGIPPILSDVGDYGKMISDGVDGFVVPTGNLDAAVDCLERVTMLSEREYQLMQTNAFKLGSQFDYRKYGTLFGNELSEFLGR